MPALDAAAGELEDGPEGTAGFACGTTAEGAGAAGGFITAGAETVGAAAEGDTGPGASGLLRTPRVAASLACASLFSAASAADSASEAPLICLRTFTATSSGIELECVFFSATP
jgi:hypothetical protein